MKASNKEGREKIRIARMGPLVTSKQLLRILEQLEPLLGVELHIDGLQRAQTLSGGGLKLQLPASTAAGTSEIWSNWQPTFVSSTAITVSPGSFNLTTPFIGGTAINASTPPQLTVHATSLQIVYLVVDTTIQTNIDNFVTGFTIKSPTSSNLTIEAHSSAQTSTNTKRFFELFRWQAGALVNRTRYNNISARAEDDGIATGNAYWVTW
jgi:hypothetical protein